MTRQTVPLGRIFGIKIELDYSWFLIFLPMTWMLASHLPLGVQELVAREYWASPPRPPSCSSSACCCTSWASVVALLTRSASRSPCSSSAACRSGYDPPARGAEFLIAIAGPMVSLVLGFLFLLLENARSGGFPSSLA